jgi:hypothetical protein
MGNFFVTAQDFERLTDITVDLHQHPDGALYERQMGRFENAEGHYTLPPRKPWKWGHWLEDGWASVVLARTFLLDNGHDFEVFYDTTYPTDAGGVVIFTDYHKED